MPSIVGLGEVIEFPGLDSGYNLGPEEKMEGLGGWLAELKK